MQIVSKFRNTAAYKLRGVLLGNNFKIPGLRKRKKQVHEAEDDLLDHSNLQYHNRVWCGDDWFESVKTAATIGNLDQHTIMQAKIAQARYPTRFL